MTTLTETDERVLAALTEREEFDALAGELGAERQKLRDRLARLVDDGLVVESGEQTFQLTASGRRVLATSRPDETADRATLSPEEEAALDALDLGPDRKEAVWAAYLFLRHWGDATAAEITAAIYPERPVRSEWATARDWWEGGVRDLLASLPTVDESDDPAWTCSASTAEGHTVDGRHVSGNYGSVRHAIEHLDGSDGEVAAVRAAFAHLFWCGPVTTRELRAAIYPQYPAGYDADGDWWEYVEAALRCLPGVERESDDGGWRYASGEPGSDSQSTVEE